MRARRRIYGAVSRPPTVGGAPADDTIAVIVAATSF